jgi:hypothetical protein
MIVTNYIEWKRINEDEEVDLDNFDFDSIDLDSLDFGDANTHDDETANTLGLSNIEDTPIEMEDGSRMILKDFASFAPTWSDGWKIETFVKNDIISQDYVDTLSKANDILSEIVEKSKVEVLTSTFINDKFNKVKDIVNNPSVTNSTEIMQYIENKVTSDRAIDSLKHTIKYQIPNNVMVVHQNSTSDNIRKNKTIISGIIRHKDNTDGVDVRHLWDMTEAELRKHKGKLHDSSMGGIIL